MRELLAGDGDGGLRALALLLDDAGRLAAQIAQVIQLGATHLAAAHHLDRVDHRRHHREDALDAFAVGNLANGKTLVEAAAAAADADAFIGLHAGAIAFDHLDVDDQGVAGSEIRDRAGGGQLVELLFFELLNKVHLINLHRRRAPAGLRGAARTSIYPAIARISRCYTASAGRCHPSVLLFGRIRLALIAHRSGRLCRVRASASACRQAATLAWSPEVRISGIWRPSKACGRVYCGYSSSPSEKLSSVPEASLPITPGSSRTQASISAIAAISPPEST